MKTKSLFDHINHVTQKQTQTYWDDMTDADKRVGQTIWSTGFCP